VKRRYRRGTWPARDELVRLVSAAQRCEPHALELLLATLRPSFVAVFAHRIETDAAEDLTQAALIRVSNEIARIEPGRVERYVRIVARSLVQAEHHRRERARQRLAPQRLGRTVASPFDVESAMEYEELVADVQRAIAVTLTPEMGAVLSGVLGGMSLTEIASMVGSSPLAVRLLLRRARAALRRTVDWKVDGLEWRTR
jgi:RNA polymerase sigma factor (sigma-70 family)